MERKWIKLEEINPIDDQHGSVMDLSHRENTDFVKELILSGSHITPIALDVNLKIMDGHARFYANQELNIGSIEAFVGNLPPAFEHGMFMIEHDNYLMYPKLVFHKEHSTGANVGITIWWRHHEYSLPSGMKGIKYD